MRLFISLMLVLIALPAAVDAKKTIVKVDAPDLETGSGERGSYAILTLPIPEDVIGKRLDSVMLEFYVDVVSEGIDAEFVPSIEVYPLTAARREGRSPVYSTSHPTSRPIGIGERQRVNVDISDIVKAWLAEPTRNFGVIIGSFSGPVLDDLNVRSDVLEGSHAVQATFYYQNRFGQRVTNE